MRVAFDVQGTLTGPNENLVLSLLGYLRENGHECVVWSNSLSYAHDKAKELDLGWQTKFSNRENDGEYYFDLAIEDDRSQTWLSAKRIVWVDELPEEKNWSEFLKGIL